MTDFKPIPILYDGKPAVITGFENEGYAPIALIRLEDGREKWAYWPSPRIKHMETTT